MAYRVGIVMGSDSDLPVMQEAASALSEFGIESEMRVISAHRTPHRASEYASTAVDRGLSAVIAGAGGAAHLAGVLAAHTPLPVIGVPIRSAALNGMDSLLATVQMPSGGPVAPVAIDGARNAGILAAQILGATDAQVRERIYAYKQRLEAAVVAKDDKLQQSRTGK